MLSVSDIELFFFQAMKNGYASSPAKGTIAELPGSKTITFQDGNLQLVDCWFAADNGRSFGNTIIFKDEKPIWMMHYWGHYDKGVISFLKKALAENYNRDHSFTYDFNGCRGPKLFNGVGMTYVNLIAHKSLFEEFAGHEEIIGDHIVRGWHYYHGWMLQS